MSRLLERNNFILFGIAASIFVGIVMALLISQIGYIVVPGIFAGILVLLIIYKTQGLLREKVSYLLSYVEWYHICWLLIFLSSLTFRTRSSQTIEESPIDIWALYRIGLVGLVALIMMIRLVTRKTDFVGALFRGVIGALAIYGVVSVVSTAWSVNRFWTLYRSSEFFVDIMLIAATFVSIKSVAECHRYLNWVIMLQGFLMVSIWSGIIFFPNYALQPIRGIVNIQLIGVLPNVSANGVGQVGALISIVALIRLFYPNKHKYFYSVVLIMSLLTLFLAQSRSSILALGVAIIASLLVTRRFRILFAIGLIMLILLTFTDFGSTFTQFYLRGQDEALFGTLSGRTDWWDASLTLLADRPLTGYGAYAAARFLVLTQLGYESTSSIHNVWLEVLLGTSFLGIVPLASAIAGSMAILSAFLLNMSQKVVASRMATELIGILTLLLVRTVFTSGVFIWHVPLFFGAALVFAEFLRRNFRAILRAYNKKDFDAPILSG